MKKVTLFLTALFMSLSMVAAPAYLVQSGQTGDPVWQDSVATTTGATIVNLATLSKEFDEWINGVASSEIWVAAGTYYINSGITAVNGYSIYGGFAGTETSIDQRAMLIGGHAWDFANETIIDGDNVRIVLKGKNVQNSVWNGLTIKNGASSDENAGVARMHNNSTFEACKFINNKSTKSGAQGGVLQSYNGTNEQIINCYFEGNSAVQGGAIYGNNTTNQTLTIKGCMFKGNTATGTANAGGAVHVQGKGILLIDGCIFTENVAAGNGAAISSDVKADAVATATVSNCLIYGQKTEGKPAIYMAVGKIYNNTIVNNAGGALYTSYASYKVDDVTYYPGVSIINNIVWGANKAQASISFNNGDGTCLKNNAFVFEPTATKAALTDNIVIDSLDATKYFVDANANNFALINRAPMVDAGMDLSAEGDSIDLLGVRHEVGMFDMGCYEFAGEKYHAITGITLNKEVLYIKLADSKKLTATIVPDNATDKTITWTSLNEDIATVSDGTVKGIAYGVTQVVAKAGEYSDTCEIHVVAAAPAYLVQSGQTGDPVWQDSVATTTGATIVNLATLSKEFDEWINGVASSEIWVAAGTYYINSGITAVNGYSIYGGFAGTETSIDQRAMLIGGHAWDFANETIIDGDNVRIVLKGKNVQNSVWNGLTIKNGASSDENAGVARMHNNSTFEACKFINNKSTKSGAQGGVLQSYNGTNEQIINCYFEGNSAVQGGAIYGNNTTNQTLTIKGCMFKGNTATGTANAGGAVHVQGKGILLIDGCIFTENVAAGNGAAISSDVKADAVATATVSNCLIYGQKTEGKPAIYMAVGKIYNNTIVNNAGGALYTSYASYKVDDVTYYPGVSIINNIVWGANKAQASISFNNGDGTCLKNNAFVFEPTATKAALADNIVIDSLQTIYFTNIDADDYTLTQQAASMIHTGMDLSAEGITCDILGVARVAGQYDMGCYTYINNTPTYIENVDSTSTSTQKVLMNGRLYIIRNGILFDTLGHIIK